MEEDRKRMIADILGNLSYFTDRIRWVMPKDLKPRMLVGMKSDGEPVDIHDDDGYPKMSGVPNPVEDIGAIGNFAWTGTSGAINGTTMTSVGYKMLIFFFVMPTWTSAPTTVNYYIQFYKNGAWFTAQGGGISGIDKTNLAATMSIHFMVTSGTEDIPLGEFAEQWRMVLTTVGGTANGVVVAEAMGVREL